MKRPWSDFDEMFVIGCSESCENEHFIKISKLHLRFSPPLPPPPPPTHTHLIFYAVREHSKQSMQIIFVQYHDDIIKWKHFPRYWPFVRGIHRLPVDSPIKGQWRGALMLSLICAWNKRLNKQSRRRWFETESRSLWRHCNVSHDSPSLVLDKIPFWPNPILYPRAASASHTAINPMLAVFTSRVKSSKTLKW